MPNSGPSDGRGALSPSHESTKARAGRFADINDCGSKPCVDSGIWGVQDIAGLFSDARADLLALQVQNNPSCAMDG